MNLHTALLRLEEMATAAKYGPIGDEEDRAALTFVWNASPKRQPDLYRTFWEQARAEDTSPGSGIGRSQSVNGALTAIYRDVRVERTIEMNCNAEVWNRARARFGLGPLKVPGRLSAADTPTADPPTDPSHTP